MAFDSWIMMSKLRWLGLIPIVVITGDQRPTAIGVVREAMIEIVGPGPVDCGRSGFEESGAVAFTGLPWSPGQTSGGFTASLGEPGGGCRRSLVQRPRN